MNISYIINELEQIKEQHGDISVVTQSYNDLYEEYDLDYVKEVYVLLDSKNKKIVALK